MNQGEEKAEKKPREKERPENKKLKTYNFQHNRNARKKYLECFLNVNKNNATWNGNTRTQ